MFSEDGFKNIRHGVLYELNDKKYLLKFAVVSGRFFSLKYTADNIVITLYISNFDLEKYIKIPADIITDHSIKCYLVSIAADEIINTFFSDKKDIKFIQHEEEIFFNSDVLLSCECRNVTLYLDSDFFILNEHLNKPVIREYKEIERKTSLINVKLGLGFVEILSTDKAKSGAYKIQNVTSFQNNNIYVHILNRYVCVNIQTSKNEIIAAEYVHLPESSYKFLEIGYLSLYLEDVICLFVNNKSFFLDINVGSTISLRLTSGKHINGELLKINNSFYFQVMD
ncbi:hypothetical protein AIG44_24730 [Salmonella enterica subsp. enterica serovar Bredeney]|nr:hypothetical protein [Salmonella enterica subsp. enterica serovar Bredeney]